MKILHWNIHMWTDADGVDNVDRVIELIGDLKPDVVSLVEVDEQWGSPTKLQRVAETLGYHWAFIPAFEYREAGGFGNALLSKLPFQSVQQWHLLPPMLYDGNEITEPRTALWADVDTIAGRLSIGSTHLPRSHHESRRSASARLLDLIERVGGPYIVLGDYNRPPSDWLGEARQFAPNPPLPTYPAQLPTEAIDYCIAQGVAVEFSRVLQSTASDHLPIVVEISA